MTLQQVLKHAVDCLAPRYGNDEARAMSRWMISSLTGYRENELSTVSTAVANDSILPKLEGYLDLLLQGVPLQYVLHEAWFCGLKLYVDNRVLIPRPETEELVEWIIDDVRFPQADSRILDMGTGSGCIPIAIKRRLGKPTVYGCDISEDALAVARINAGKIGVEVDFFYHDILSKQPPEMDKIDILISNPPYIPANEMASIDDHVTDHEPHTALFVPTEDPQLFYRAICTKARQLLKPGGMIYLELHAQQGLATARLFQEAGYETELRNDISGNVRMLKAW